MVFIIINLSCVNAVQNDNNDFSSLNSEINNSSQLKTFNLTKDYVFNSENDGEYSSGITIDIDDLIIDGQGHTINANNQARIFNIQSNNVTLKNLVLINGFSDSQGAAVYWTGLNGEITNSTFKNSISKNIGGAVYFSNSAVVSDSKFINNSANFGGAVNLDNAIVTNCEFENNFAKYLGGAIFCSQHSDIFNSTFRLNEAGDGGGIYFFTTGLVENTLFKRNNAIGYGGAITNEGKTVIRNSTFIKNTGAYSGAIFLKGDGDIDNSIFNENSAKAGGAIDSYCDNTVIKNCIFNYNEAEKGKSLQIINKNIEIENATFNNNISYYESEIYMECNNPTLVNLTFNNITKQSENTSNTPKIISKKKTTITAKTKTFKLKTKTKKYQITLKSGKTLLKNKKITLKIKGKIYSAKTNNKGKATFKLKITKKGKFKAIIRFSGNKLYKASKKVIYIKIKK